MYQISINSTRIYPETGDIFWNDFLCIQSNNVDFRKIFMHLYNLLFLEETNIKKYNSIMQGRKLYDYVRSTFGLCALHVNSIIPYVKGMIKAQKTQQQNHIKQIEETIKAKKDSIKRSEKQLKGLYELADRLHKCIKYNYILYSKMYKPI